MREDRHEAERSGLAVLGLGRHGIGENTLKRIPCARSERAYAERSASLGWEVVMATIPWIRDVDAAFARASSEGKPVLLDFSAAPM